jgi:heme/copper-type cytochrome/quinol oxidase subunit 2
MVKLSHSLSSVVLGGLVLGGLALGVVTIAAQAAGTGEQDDTRREVSVAARDNAFTPAKIEVRRNDVVKITFTAEDRPHSFNIDEYRIAKRARPGQPAVFEFRADRVGTFPYYCNLTSPAGKHDMRGELIVSER